MRLKFNNFDKDNQSSYFIVVILYDLPSLLIFTIPHKFQISEDLVSIENYFFVQSPLLLEYYLFQMRCFQNCLDYFHMENLQKLISRTLPHQTTRKRSKVDPDRTTYATLLDHAVSELSRFRREAENNDFVRQPSKIDIELITPLSDELIELSKRQCNERAMLFQIIVAFYKQALMIMDEACQVTIKNSLKEYFQNLQAHRKQSESQITALNNEMSRMRKQNDEKWKTFYMIVKDNRVLRRHKGKLMRTLEQERHKVSNAHEEMMQIARQNQKNKLLANYNNGPEHLTQFLNNSKSILKLEQFMKDYPKKTKKLLDIDLKKLEASQNFNLDEKIMYIIKAAKESEEIFDEYEDLVDVNQRPNKIIFNISTQTDLFDIGLDGTQKIEQYRPLKKFGRNIHCQTEKQRDLKICRKVLDFNETIQEMPESKIITRRRKALKTNTIEDPKIIDAIKHFKQRSFCKKVCNIKIICKKPINKAFKFQSNVYNLAIQYDEEDLQDYPTLTTNFKLQQDIKRSKDFVRKQVERRSSHKSSSGRPSIDLKVSIMKQELAAFDPSKLKIKGLFNQTDTEISQRTEINRPQAKIKTFEKKTLENILQQTKMISQQMEEEQIVQPQKYIINPLRGKKSTRKLMESNRSFDSRKIKTAINMSNTEEVKEGSIKQLETQSKVEEHQKILKEIINKTFRKMNNEAQHTSASNVSNISHVKSQNSGLELTSQRKSRQIRKSGFAIYKKMNLVSDSGIIEQSSNQSAKRTPVARQQKAHFIKQQKLSSHTKDVKKKKQMIVPQNQSNRPSYQSSRNQTSRVKGVKVINIFSSQNSKLMQKVFRQIFIKKSQIAESAETFQVFLISYLKAVYGLNQKISISTHFTANKFDRSNPLYSLFDILLNKNSSKIYLQHLFKLLARLLIISGTHILTFSHADGKCIQEEFFKIHFSSKKCQQILQSSDILERPTTLNLCQSFVNLQFHLRRELESSQILKFLQKLLPNSQQSLTYEELRQIFYLFSLEQNHYKHLFTLKQYCNPQISIQNLCFYAIRQQWKPLLKIEDFIIESYDKLGRAKEEIESIDGAKTNQKHRWIDELIKEKGRNWNQQTFILQKYQRIIQSISCIENHNPISKHLQQIQNQFSIVNLRMQLRKESF